MIFLGTVTHNCANRLPFLFFNLFPQETNFLFNPSIFHPVELFKDLFNLKLKSNQTYFRFELGQYSDIATMLSWGIILRLELFKLDCNNYLIDIASGNIFIHMQFACEKEGNKRKMFSTVLFFLHWYTKHLKQTIERKKSPVR